MPAATSSSFIGKTPLSPNRAVTMSPALPDGGLPTAALTSARNASAIFLTSAGGSASPGFLGRCRPQSLIAAAMSDWGRHLPKKPGEADPPAEVKKMAEAFRAEVKAAVGKPPSGKAGDMVTALFGDKGVFPMKDEDVAAGMSPDRKATYDKMKA